MWKLPSYKCHEITAKSFLKNMLKLSQQESHMRLIFTLQGTSLYTRSPLYEVYKESFEFNEKISSRNVLFSSNLSVVMIDIFMNTR